MAKINQKGQALIEYVMLLAIIVSVYANLMKLLSQSNAIQNLQRPFTKDYTAAYRYGHPLAKGQDNGGPLYIPALQGKENAPQNFRIFYNPTINE